MLGIFGTALEYIFEFLEPIAKPVGMIVLILLMMGSTLYCTVWLIKKIWKGLVVTAAMIFFLVVVYTILPML